MNVSEHKQGCATKLDDFNPRFSDFPKNVNHNGALCWNKTEKQFEFASF